MDFFLSKYAYNGVKWCCMIISYGIFWFGKRKKKWKQKIIFKGEVETGNLENQFFFSHGSSKKKIYPMIFWDVNGTVWDVDCTVWDVDGTVWDVKVLFGM